MKKRQRISLKLDSRLAHQINRVARVEGRSWREQAEWFLEVFAGLAERMDVRPMPRQCPKNLKQDAHWSLFLTISLYQRLKAFSETERLTLVEFVRQMLWTGVEYWQKMKLLGVRKEVFKEFFLRRFSPRSRR